jgi:hypothetical protein
MVDIVSQGLEGKPVLEMDGGIIPRYFVMS